MSDVKTGIVYGVMGYFSEEQVGKIQNADLAVYPIEYSDMLDDKSEYIVGVKLIQLDMVGQTNVYQNNINSMHEEYTDKLSKLDFKIEDNPQIWCTNYYY